MTIEDIVAEGDRVAIRFTAGGTQDGELFGIPPTHRRGIVPGMIFARFEDGKWAEDSFVWDQFGMLQPLGVIPQPETATA
jgi:predicted ester cyclase